MESGLWRLRAIRSFQAFHRLCLITIWIFATIPQMAQAAPAVTIAAKPLPQSTPPPSPREPSWLPPSQNNNHPLEPNSKKQSGQLRSQPQTQPVPAPPPTPTISPPKPRLGLAITGTSIAGGGLVLLGASISMSENTGGDQIGIEGLLFSLTLISGLLAAVGGGIMAAIGWNRYVQAKRQLNHQSYQQNRFERLTSFPIRTWISHHH